MYCCVPVGGTTVAVGGVTAIETSGTGVTVRTVVPVIPAELAEIVVVPAATLVARPETLMVATVVIDDSQLAVDVRTFVLPSLYVPVATNCCVVPAVMDGLAGLTWIVSSVTVGGGVVLELDPPQPTNRLTPDRRIDSSNRFISTPRALTRLL